MWRKRQQNREKSHFVPQTQINVFYWLAKLKMLCTDFQRRIRGRRRFEQHANFSLFCRFLRRHPGAQAAAKIHFYTREVVYVEKMTFNRLLKENLSAIGVKGAQREK